jgi:probable addiction module antidote protein
MAKVTVSDWDPAEMIETKEDVAAFLEGALQENDPAFLLKTIGHVARSKGMQQLANELNLNKNGLHKAFSEKDNPSFLTVVKILENLGYCLKIEQKISA